MNEESQKPGDKDESAIERVMENSALKMLTVMGEGVALLGMDGDIRKVNPAFASLTEYDAHELEGQRIQRLLPEIFVEDAEAIEETLFRLSLKQGTPGREDALHVITPKGTHRWVVPTLTHFKTGEGAASALVFTLRDITALVNAQEARNEIERAYSDRLRRLADRLASTKEQERRHVATQLHDTVIQSLSLCNIRLGSFRERLGEGDCDPSLLNQMDEIRRIVEGALTECREMLSELTPPLLYELGLGPALSDLAEKYQSLYGATIRIHGEDPPDDVPARLLGVLFEGARELITNAIMYAGECRVDVYLKQVGDEAVIEVHDSGAGFDMTILEGGPLNKEAGFGLFNVRERLHHAGGILEIRSAPGEGTSAIIRASLKAFE